MTTYARTPGRSSGRFAGGPAALCARATSNGYVAAGADELDISPAGAGAAISGDPSVALIAQVNRFQARYGKPLYPLATGNVSIEVAVVALGLAQARLIAALARLPDAGTQAELVRLTTAMASPVAYVMANRASLTRSIALWGDTQGLPPATVGITSGSSGSFPYRTVAIIAIVGGLALASLTRRK